MARLPHTNIAVDYWRADPGITLRFLTHCHADHTKGLTPRWNSGIIYCSAISARILKKRFAIDPATIRELEINSTSLIFLDEGKTVGMTVTVIDANHCPGSVMFLFQGYFGNILHTDILYLDNTYLDSRQAQFPSREEAYEEMRDVVTKHLDHIIYVGVDSIGKEELLIQLGRDLNIKIAVSEDRYHELELMGLAEECFTTDDTEALLRVMPKERITLDFLREANVSKPTIAILPTGWREKWASKLRAGRIFHVPYSLHSSYAEILDFVSVIRPRSVRPIVQDHGDVSVLSHLLDSSPPAPVRMPDCLRTPTLARLAPLTPIQRAPPPAARRRSLSAGTLVIVKAEMDEEHEEKKVGPRRLTHEVNALDLLADSLDNPVKREEHASEDGDAAAPPLSRSQSDPTDTSSNGVSSSKHFRKQKVEHTPIESVVMAAPAAEDLPPLLSELAPIIDESQLLLPPPPSPSSRTLPTYSRHTHPLHLQLVPVLNNGNSNDSSSARRILPSYCSPVDILLPRHVDSPNPPPQPPPAAAASTHPFSPPPPAAASRKRRYAHPQADQAHAARAVLARLGLRPPPPNSKNSGN